MICVPGHSNAGQKIIGSTIATSSFSLTSVGDSLRNDLEKATLYSEWQDKYSEKFIETRISEILSRVAECRDTSSIPLEIRELVSEYENHKTEYLVVLPLVGVTVDETLKLGQASLRRYDQIVLDSFETKCRSVINQANIQTEDSRAKLVEDFRKNHLNKLLYRTCSEVSVQAESIRAREIALEKTNFALDLIRYTILFLYGNGRRRSVGVVGESTGESREYIAISSDARFLHFGSQTGNQPLCVNKRIRVAMEEIGVYELAELGLNQQATEFEKVILVAVHWLASAQTQMERANSLLNLVTCLETLFKTESGAPITATIAEGVAVLTVHTPEERKQRKSRVTYFYGLRSKLTHNGVGAVTGADLDELTLICRDLTLLMIRNRSKFKKHQDFKLWLDEQKLGAVVRFPD